MLRRTVPLLTLTLAAAVLSVAPSVTTAPAVFAEGEKPPPDVDGPTAQKALKRFKNEFDTVDIDFKLDAVRKLGKVQHKNVANTLLKLLKEKDEHVVAAAIEALGNQKSSAKKVGAKVRKILKDEGESEKILLAAVRTIFALRYTKAVDEIEDLITHDSDEIVATVFQCYGDWKDDSAMKKFLLWWEMFPDEKEFKNVSVTVDTGTAGSGDQKAAQAKGRAMLAKQKAWRYRPTCTKALRGALKSITGKGFRLPNDLRDYMDEPKKYNDPELILTRVPEEKQREYNAGYQKLIEKAKAITDEKMPVDESNESNAKERGKIYLSELRLLRKDWLEEIGVTLSEMRVILDVAQEKGW